MTWGIEMKIASTPVKRLSSRDYDGIIIDLLDDIVLAELNAKRLVDRLDAISKRSTLRVVDIDLYLWTVAGIATISFVLGMVLEYIASVVMK